MSGKSIKWANNQGKSLTEEREIPQNQGYKGRTNLFVQHNEMKRPEKQELPWYWKMLGYETEPTGREGVHYYTGHAEGGKVDAAAMHAVVKLVAAKNETYVSSV